MSRFLEKGHHIDLANQLFIDFKHLCGDLKKIECTLESVKKDMINGNIILMIQIIGGKNHVVVNGTLLCFCATVVGWDIL